MRTFNFVVERDSATGHLVGYAPGWPGAHTQGADIDDLQQNIRLNGRATKRTGLLGGTIWS